MGRVLVRATWPRCAHTEPQHSSLQVRSSVPSARHTKPRSRESRVADVPAHPHWDTVGRLQRNRHHCRCMKEETTGSITVRSFFCFPCLIADLNELSTLMLFVFSFPVFLMIQRLWLSDVWHCLEDISASRLPLLFQNVISTLHSFGVSQSWIVFP